MNYSDESHSIQFALLTVPAPSQLNVHLALHTNFLEIIKLELLALYPYWHNLAKDIHYPDQSELVVELEPMCFNLSR